MVDFLSDLAGTLGADPSQITSTYRSQARQDQLRASGATQTRHSTHTDGNAFDYVPNKGQTADDISNALAAYGYPDSHVLDETAPGQGTGPHYHVSNTNFHGAFLPGATPQSPTAPTNTQVAASSTTAPSANDPLNPFQSSPKVQALSQGAQDAIDQAATAVQSADAGLQQNQKEHAAAMASSVAQRDAITKDIDSATTELQTRATPLFAQRAAIAQRRVELADMNPIKKAFLGLFNSNYDDDALAGKDKVLAGALGEMGDEYAFTTRNRQALMQDIETRQSGNDAMSNLTAASLELDKNVANDSVSIAQQRLSASLMGIQSGQALTAAQVQARQVTLSQMTPQDINTAVAQAKANGGTAMVNGVPLSMAELTQRSTALQEQDIGLKTAKLGLQGQELAVQNAGEQRVISHMSGADLESAIANDGMYHGHRLNQEMLTQAYSVQQSRIAGIAQNSMTNVDGGTYTAGIDRLNASTQETMRRVAGITGTGLPGPYKDFVNGMVAASQAWKTKIDAAPEAAKPQLRAAALQDIGKRYGNVGDVIDSVAQGMTRNKDTQVLLGGWMKGIPVTGEAATRGLIGLFQGGNGLPKGVSMSGPAGKMFAAAQAAYNGVVQANGGQQAIQDVLAGKGKISKDEFNRQVMTAVTQAGGGAWNNALFAGLFPQTTQMAKIVGHPAGQINPADLAAASHTGDQTALHLMAQRLGWSDDQANQVFGPGGSKAQGYAAIAAKGGKAGSIPYAQASSMYQMDSNTNMLRALDASPSARPGFVPSHQLTDFMNSPQYAAKLGQYGSMVPHQDFGSFVGDAISNGSIASLMGAHGQGLYKAVGAIGSQDQAAIRDKVGLYQNDPMKRTAVILSGTGLNQHDQQVLMAGIKNSVIDPNSTVLGNAGGVGAAISDKIDSTILHGKFQDPHLEKLRKTAAQNWETLAPHTDNIVQRLFKSVF